MQEELDVFIYGNGKVVDNEAHKNYSRKDLEILYRTAEANGRDKGNEDCACREEQEHMVYIGSIIVWSLIALLVGFNIGLWIG
jgi:hypothetical protein